MALCYAVLLSIFFFSGLAEVFVWHRYLVEVIVSRNEKKKKVIWNSWVKWFSAEKIYNKLKN